ncbi:hypothetical protein Tco_0175646 [Tanacetum coccineum]
MSKYSTSCSLTAGSSLWESSFVLTISINITSSSSPLVQTSSVLEDWGINLSDSKNELSLRTFSVMNEIDRSGGMEGLTWIFSGSSFSSSLFSSGLSLWDSPCCLGWIVIALIEPWIWVEHCGSIIGDRGRCHDEDIVAEFCSLSRWKELSKEMSSKILPYCDNRGLSRLHNQSIERDRLIGIGFVLDFVEFISFTFGDKEMILVIEATAARVGVRTYLLGGAIDGSEANGIIRDPKLE